MTIKSQDLVLIKPGWLNRCSGWQLKM